MGSFDLHLLVTLVGSPLLLAASWVTLWVAVASQLIGVAIGFVIGPMLMARSPVPRMAAWTYSWLFRGTPLLAQILFFYAVLPQFKISLGIVATGLLALGLNEGARMGEIVRSGLMAVPHEQREAATALGLRRWQGFVLVTLPQAFRTMIPQIGNNFSYMIKATSLLSVIAFSELLRTAQQLAQTLSRPLEVYAAAAVWYLILVSAWTLIQRAIERRFSRGGPDPARDAALMGDRPPAADGLAATTLIEVRRGKPALIAARGLTKHLGRTLALDHVDLSVDRGEVVVVMGPSGSGKSTLLRALNWLDPPDAGHVEIDGADIAFRAGADGRPRPRPEADLDRQRQRVAMVFQRFNLFPHLTACDNVALGLRRLHGVRKRAARVKAMALLEQVGLGDKARSSPRDLSGGQRQRVAIARALAMDPIAILFDEPTSALDPETVNDVLDVMRRLAKEGTTMIVVTHELGFARQVADRVVFMDRGRIVAEGHPATLLSNPQDGRLQNFLGRLSEQPVVA